MDDVTIDFKFNVGKEVGGRGKQGTISRRWSKIVCVGNHKYIISRAYTVVPKSGNQFKLSEDEAEEIVIPF